MNPNIRFRFEKLEVWQSARLLNREVYQVTRSFPVNEQFGLTSQLRRASVSVPSNIAEGSGRNSDKDFAHFLEQAYGSLMEVASDTFLAVDEGYLTVEQSDLVLNRAQIVAGQLVSLNRSLLLPVTKVRIP